MIIFRSKWVLLGVSCSQSPTHIWYQLTHSRFLKPLFESLVFSLLYSFRHFFWKKCKVDSHTLCDLFFITGLFGWFGWAGLLSSGAILHAIYGGVCRPACIYNWTRLAPIKPFQAFLQTSSVCSCSQIPTVPLVLLASPNFNSFNIYATIILGWFRLAPRKPFVLLHLWSCFQSHLCHFWITPRYLWFSTKGRSELHHVDIWA